MSADRPDLEALFARLTQMRKPDELQAEVDMEWLRELMDTEGLVPKILRETAQRQDDIHRRSKQLGNSHEELRDLWLEHEKAVDDRFHAQEDFWFRLGLALGAELQWQSDNRDRLEQLPGGAPDDLRLMPRDYLWAIASAARWVDIEHRKIEVPDSLPDDGETS